MEGLCDVRPSPLLVYNHTPHHLVFVSSFVSHPVSPRALAAFIEEPVTSVFSLFADGECMCALCTHADTMKSLCMLNDWAKPIRHVGFASIPLIYCFNRNAEDIHKLL